MEWRTGLGGNESRVSLSIIAVNTFQAPPYTCFVLENLCYLIFSAESIHKKNKNNLQLMNMQSNRVETYVT